MVSVSPATGSEFSILPAENSSGNWVKVVQRLPVRIYLEPMPGEPPLRAGMTATVSIDTKRERKLANLLEVFSTAKASRDLAPFENQQAVNQETAKPATAN